jgi:hypothetical protein
MDTTDPITSTFAANFNYDANELNAQFIDIAATLGGPLLRDKLWFFVAYEYVNNEQTPTFSTNTWGFEGNYPFAKLSWQAGSSWRVVGKYSGDPVTIANANALDTHYRDPAAMANRDQGGFVANGELNGVLSDSLMWNTIVGVKRATLDQLPITGPDVMSHWSYASGLFTQNYDRQELSNRDRDEISTDLTWFVDELAGSHEFKFGLEYGKFMENASTICLTSPSDGRYGCAEGTTTSFFRDNQRYEDFQHPYYWEIRDTIPPEDFVGDMYSAFAQDAWRPIAATSWSSTFPSVVTTG